MKTIAEFVAATGREPTDDDMDRVNCDSAGDIMHMCCGWCAVHDKPMFDCHYYCHRREFVAKNERSRISLGERVIE